MIARAVHVLCGAALAALALVFVLRAAEYASDGGSIHEVAASCLAAAINTVLAALVLRSPPP